MARLIRPTWAIRCVQSGCKTLFEVAQDLTKMQIEVNVSEADIGRVKEGQKVQGGITVLALWK